MISTMAPPMASTSCFQDRIFYANGWAPFLERPELLEDVRDRLYCVRDAVPKNGAGDGARVFDAALTKIFMGPAGAWAFFERRRLEMMVELFGKTIKKTWF